MAIYSGFCISTNNEQSFICLKHYSKSIHIQVMQTHTRTQRRANKHTKVKVIVLSQGEKIKQFYWQRKPHNDKWLKYKSKSVHIPVMQT